MVRIGSRLNGCRRKPKVSQSFALSRGRVGIESSCTSITQVGMVVFERRETRPFSTRFSHRGPPSKATWECHSPGSDSITESLHALPSTERVPSSTVKTSYRAFAFGRSSGTRSSAACSAISSDPHLRASAELVSGSGGTGVGGRPVAIGGRGGRPGWGLRCTRRPRFSPKGQFASRKRGMSR